MSNQTTHSDILIVGAGMSGLFAAWRLLTANPSLKINIIDKLGRTGGRLQTTFVNINSPDGKPNVHDEEGGMRFVPEESGQMQHLWKLINDMKCAGYALNPVDFVMGDSNNRYYIRGKSFTQKDIKDSNDAIWSTLFNLAPDEEGKNPTDILEEVVSDIMMQNNKDPKYRPKSPSEWIEFRNSFTYDDYDDKPVVINKWGFWSMLRRYGLTQECIEMLSHVLGFMGPFQDNVNAGEGLQILFDFPKPDKTQFKTLENGFEALPDALEKEIKKKGTFYLSTQIKSITKQNGTYSAACVNVDTGVSTTFTADKVILAIPKKPLKELAKTSPELLSDPLFHNAVNSVKDMELTKVGLYFKERWWHSDPRINITNGPNFTDLPLGSVYTFSQFPADPDHDKAYNGPAALTQYTDYIRGNFWMELQNVGDKYEPIGVSQPDGSYPASRALVEEMMKQLKLLFGLSEDDSTVPMPVLSTYRVWGEGEFGYGYHQYKLNVDDKADVYPNIYNPDKEELYVCNESWSPEQGWVEGALIMSDYVMVKGFGMEPYAADGIAG
jgi:monoamine oxidase